MRKTEKLSIVIIIAISVIAYWPITGIFFQQDEWLGLGGALSRSSNGGLTRLFADMFPSGGQAIRLVPLTSLVNYLIFNFLGLKMWAYGVMALTLAISNAILIFFTIKRFSKSSIIATFTALFWVTGNLASQSITWIAAIVPSQFSVTGFIISLYCLLTYLESTQKRLFWLVLSLVFMTVSLSFKESGIYYIITFSLIVWLLRDRVKYWSRKESWVTILVLLPALLILLAPRLLVLFDHQTSFSFAGSTISSANIIYNIFLLPARSAYHVFLPVHTIYDHIYSVSRVHYAEDAGLGGCAVECLVGDAYSLMASFYIIVGLLFAALFIEQQKRKIVLISLISFFASFLPFIVYPNRGAVLEIRYYIFPTLWMGVALSSVCYFIFSKHPKIRLPLMLIVFMPLVAFNIINIRKSMDVDIQVGKYRRDMLQTILEIKPDLHKNNVFYFFTDNTGFYEFQSGFGQTLAVWLNDTGKIPREALTDLDFYNLYYEGLKEYPSGKFGYFMTYEKLLQAFKDNRDLDVSILHAYYWNPSRHTIENVSSEIRNKLKNDLIR